MAQSKTRTQSASSSKQSAEAHSNADHATIGDIAYLHQAYAERKDAIAARLQDFRAIPPERWFYELCYCLCTPQSKAVHAAAVVAQLQAADFEGRAFDPTPLLRDPAHYIRFHNVKAARLLELRTVFPQLRDSLLKIHDSCAARTLVVTELKGVGMKEASHFLRNIGYRGLAIIDRHILKHLYRCGVITSPKPPSSVRRYEEIERLWKSFASDIRIDMDEMDLVFWSLETGEILK